MVAARPELELNTRRPFTRADAVRVGVDPKVLRTSAYRRLFRGVYVAASVPESPFIRSEGALRLHPPSAFISHTTAAALYGLPVPTDPLVHVTVPRAKDRRRHPGIRSHLRGRRTRVIRHRGLRVAHPFQMFVQLASMLGLVDLVVVGDALVKVFNVEPSALVAACKDSDGPHAAAAVRAARFVRAEVDSPMETRLRMLIVLAGLPEPKVNHKIYDEHGRLRRRLDLSYPDLRLIVEYDGRQHVERIENWDGDLDRREEFDDDGWKILIVTSRGIYKEPGRTIERVHRNLRERGYPGLPTRISEEWRPHFPVR